MQISVTLDRAADAERLATAVYRFAEAKRRPADPAPAFRLAPDGSGWVSVVELWSPEAANEFLAYWDRFRAEPFVWRGFRDI